MTSGNHANPESALTLTQAGPQLDQPVPAPAAPPALVSIVVPCCGQLEYTRLCVPSLLRWTRRPFDLLFLDSGSLDGTTDYLAGIAAAAPVHVEVVRTPAETGFAVAPNDSGLRARGELIVLLSNDTIVTERWLDHLSKLAEMDASIGMVAPMSNYAAPAQRVGPIPYRTSIRKPALSAQDVERHSPLPMIEEVNRFARAWREQHKGKWFKTNRLAGGCVLVKREVLKKIGLSLTRSALGFFDLAFLSDRITQAGYQLACCEDVFVHHFGTRSPASKERDAPDQG